MKPGDDEIVAAGAALIAAIKSAVKGKPTDTNPDEKGSPVLVRTRARTAAVVRRKGGKQIEYDFRTGRATRRKRSDAEMIDAMKRADGFRRPDLDLAGLYGEDRW